jgi:hypothetical protein
MTWVIHARRLIDWALLWFAVEAVLSPVAAQSRTAERITPVLMSVSAAPVPFTGSDGQTHLVYELWLTNFSGADSIVESVDVLGDGKPILAMDRTAISGRLKPVGQREYAETLARSVQAVLFIHVTLRKGETVPERLAHRVTARVLAAPPGQQEITDIAGEVRVDTREVVVLGPPLRGGGYISADSCCDAVRHTRAALPVNGKVRLAQRFAVDWEQLDSRNRIYAGPQTDPRSYAIFGKEALAVADARVASIVDGLPEQTPGTYPTNIPLEEADGNSVILDLGGGRYALYAHLQPRSLKVRAGDRVRRGQVLGLVGNSGNSVAPHLHFHVMDGPSPLDSNGLPYLIDSFLVTATSPGTAAFDTAEERGSPLAIRAVAPPRTVTNALPLDQLIVTFGQ